MGLWGEPLRSSFNPRARTGRDLKFLRYHLRNALFQSTRPHGARRFLLNFVLDFLAFQSTRPHGARLTETILKYNKVYVSIHAPARGATYGSSRHLWGLQRFNPRARTGRDQAPDLSAFDEYGFNPRARTGRDLRTFDGVVV